MEKFTAKIIDPIGLHARPASIIVGVASKFKSESYLHVNGNKGNLKSIMNIMALGAKKGDKITIEVNGSDEKETILAIEKSMKESNLI